MKIAICISGQVRDNTEEPFKALQQLIASLEEKNIEVTLLFSIWDEVFQKLDGAMSNFNQLKKIFADDLVTLIPPTWYNSTTLWKKLPKTYEYIVEHSPKNAKEWTQRFFPDSVIDCEDGNLLDLMFDNDWNGFSKNSKKMLYKMWKVNEIKKKIERDSGEKFDYVIRVRPDFTIKEINLDLQKDTFYIPGGGEMGKFLHDTFAMASSECIDYYCELFAKSICSDYQWGNIHVKLYEHLTEGEAQKYQVASAEKNGFKLQTMGDNKNKIDIEQMKEDLHGEFYTNFFEAVTLKREDTETATLTAIEKMETAQGLCESIEQQVPCFILIHELYLKVNKHAEALKAFLLADFIQSNLDANKLSWANRNSYIYNTIIDLVKQSGLNPQDIVEELLAFNVSTKLDKSFENSDLERLKNNMNVLLDTEKAKQSLV